MLASDAYRQLGEAAWSWVLDQVRGDDGPWLPVSVPEDGQQPTPPEDRDSLYAGIAGLAPVLAEIAQYRELREVEQALAAGIVARLTVMVPRRTDLSLYDGLAGDVMALRLLSPGSETKAMQRIADQLTSPGENTEDGPVTDIIGGLAGVVVTAVWAGGGPAEAIAAAGGESLVRAADRTGAGLDWAMRPSSQSRMPNYSHGTAGVAAALAIAGEALHRSDLVDAAIEGAAHLLAVGSLDDDGFTVPLAVPPPRAELELEPVTYSWCHGSAGTSYVFAALAKAGVTEVAGQDVAELRQRCLHSIVTSGVPRRLRPGFWDNDGRCCGTAGVGEALLDAVQDTTDSKQSATLLAAARTMGDALVERVIRDEAGARWWFREHRVDPPLLAPGTSWMQGAAGIAAYLMRLSRVVDDARDAPVVDRPDQWWGVPTRLRSAYVTGQ